MMPAMLARQASKQEQATRLCNICLELVQTYGVLREVSDYPVTEVTLVPFAIWVVPWRQLRSVDVWYDGAGKVLTLRLEESAITILKFQRGAWEDELLALPSKTDFF